MKDFPKINPEGLLVPSSLPKLSKANSKGLMRRIGLDGKKKGSRH